MSDCFVEDRNGWVYAGSFFDAFQGWCRDNRRHDLIHSTTKSNLIQEVNKIEQWRYLKTVKPYNQHSAEGRRVTLPPDRG